MTLRLHGDSITKVKFWDEIFKMTSDLSLALNFSILGLATGSNYIYLGHVMAVITNLKNNIK